MVAYESGRLQEFCYRVYMGNKRGNSKDGWLLEMVAYESGRPIRVDKIEWKYIYIEWMVM